MHINKTELVYFHQKIKKLYMYQTFEFSRHWSKGEPIYLLKLQLLLYENLTFKNQQEQNFRPNKFSSIL